MMQMCDAASTAKAVTTGETDAAVQALVRLHSPLAERSVVRLVDSLLVGADHLSTAERENTFFGRVLGVLTGSDRIRQLAIEGSLHFGLEAVAGVLDVLLERSTEWESDLAYVAIRVSELLNRLDSLDAETSLFRTQVAKQSAQLAMAVTDLEARVLRLENAQLAQASIPVAFAAWERGELASLPPVIRLLLTLDRLFWSPYGAFRRLHRGSQIEQTLARQVVESTITRLCLDFSIAPDDFLPLEAWIEPVQQLRSPVSEMVFLVTDSDDPVGSPIAAAIAAVTSNREPDGRYLPRILQPVGFARVAFADTARRFERIGK
jgi:hypothetical protein